MLTTQLAPARSRDAGFDDPSRYYACDWRARIRLEILRELLGDYRAARILDLGCGDGGISAGLPWGHVTAVDSSAGMVARARLLRGDRLEIVHSDLHSFRADEPFDLVLCLGVLAHVGSTEAVFETISGNAAPGSRAIVQFSAGPLAAAHHFTNMFRRYRPRPTSRASVIRTAEKHGFRLVDERRHLLTLPGMGKALGSMVPDYDRFVRRHPSLARWGSECIAMFEHGHANSRTRRRWRSEERLPQTASRC